MVFIIKQVLSFLKILHSENSEIQISWAIVLGLAMAMNPLASLQGVIVLLIVLFVRVQIASFFLSWFLFSLLMPLVFPFFNQLGYAVLESTSLRGTFAFMQSSFLSFTRFNNTTVMGGFLVYLLIAVPVYFLSIFLLKKYRDIIVCYIKKSKVFYLLKSSPIFKIVELYGKYKI